jgi:antitoxin CcdA
MGKTELRIEIDAALLEEAQRRGVRLDAATESGIRAALAYGQADADIESRAKRWAEENADAIRDHKERIEQYGVFGEDLRRW